MTLGDKLGVAAVLTVVALPILGVLTIRWARSAASIDLNAARAAVAGMEADGVLLERRCNPNTAAIKRTAWDALPSDDLRYTVTKVLARVCHAEGAGSTMLLVDDRGRLLTRYDGHQIVEGGMR